tara:strand:- start:270 stop:566 length:297 start_codon:yes stop_codon:yes gene_type:complete
MKITKSELNRIIAEEVEKVTTQQAKKQMHSMRQGKGSAVAAGINDQERAIMMKVLKSLQAAAAKGNIASGVVPQKLEQLLAVLEKIVGQQPQTQGEQG